MLHKVSGTTSHFPGTVYGLSLKKTVISGSELCLSAKKNLAQVGKMKRKFGPLPSQVVRRNPGQSRSERQFWKVDFWFELNVTQYWFLKNGNKSYFWRRPKEKGECRGCEEESEEDSEDFRSHFSLRSDLAWLVSRLRLRLRQRTFRGLLFIAAPWMLTVKHFFWKWGITWEDWMILWTSCDVRNPGRTHKCFGMVGKDEQRKVVFFSNRPN